MGYRGFNIGGNRAGQIGAGTILGVTKEVDMKFTRSMDRPRFQVLVLDPDLIP
jgi:hypothetical protein